jgi:hypothetical protein
VDFEVLDSTFFEIKGRVLCKAVIKVDGKQYVGTAEAKLENAVPKSADATNPFECGETSAVGRALAWAGYGSADSIASFDEIARSMSADELKQVLENQPATNNRPENNQRQQQPTSANTTSAPRPANNQQRPAPEGTAKAALLKRIDELQPANPKTGKKMNHAEVFAYVFASQIQQKKVTVVDLVKCSELTEEQQLLMQAFIDMVITQRQAAAAKQQQPAA